METTLGELLVGDCEHIQPLNHLVTTYSSYLILYKYKKAMHQSGLLLDDNRDPSDWIRVDFSIVGTAYINSL